MSFPLPNPGMSFTPFDPLPASDLNNILENIEALADGVNFDIGLNTKTTTGTVLGTSYSTNYCSVTGASTGDPVIVSFKANFLDSGSGLTRGGNVKAVCDGSDISGSEVRWITVNSGGFTSVSLDIAHTPTAASHTWALQAVCDNAASVYIQQASLKITQQP